MSNRLAGNWYLRNHRLFRCEKDEIRGSLVRVQLTAREALVINCLLDACSVEEIARELKIAKRTAKAYLNRIYIRFGITDRWVKKVRLIYLLHHPEKIGKE